MPNDGTDGSQVGKLTTSDRGFATFVRFVVPLFQPRVTRMLRMKCVIFCSTRMTSVHVFRYFDVFRGSDLLAQVATIRRAVPIRDIRGYWKTTDGHRWARISDCSVRRQSVATAPARRATVWQNRLCRFFRTCAATVAWRIVISKPFHHLGGPNRELSCQQGCLRCAQGRRPHREFARIRGPTVLRTDNTARRHDSTTQLSIEETASP